MTRPVCGSMRIVGQAGGLPCLEAAGEVGHVRMAASSSFCPAVAERLPPAQCRTSFRPSQRQRLRVERRERVQQRAVDALHRVLVHLADVDEQDLALASQALTCSGVASVTWLP